MEATLIDEEKGDLFSPSSNASKQITAPMRLRRPGTPTVIIHSMLLVSEQGLQIFQGLSFGSIVSEIRTPGPL